MRLAIISTPVFSVPVVGYSGLEHLAWLQAKGLAALGHQVALIAPEGSWCPGVQMIHTGPPGTWDEKKAYESYWKTLVNFDVILDNTWQKWPYVLKQEGVLKAPVLGVCHAPINTMYQQLPPVEKPCIVCISEDQAAHFKALFSKDARVAYNGCDAGFYQPLGLPRSGRFLFLARFSSIKGPAMAQDVCLETSTELDMVGDTSITNEPELLEHCKKKADGKQIHIYGNQTRGCCVWFHSQSRALIHCNKIFREPFGLSPVESQLCGSPVLAFDFGAMRETVKHGETGFLVNSQQEMVDIIRSKALDGLSRKRCREWASQFSVERMCQRYEQLCREAIDGGGW